MGDAEVDVTAGEVDFCGGPFAQADFCGSWVEIFGVDVVEGLLILEQKSQAVRYSDRRNEEEGVDGRVVG